MATYGGAEVLNFNQLVGLIEVGKKAELTLVETQSVNMFPIFDPYSALVYSATANNVSDVWENGCHLVKNKQLTKQNPKQLREELFGHMDIFIEEANRRKKDIKKIDF